MLSKPQKFRNVRFHRILCRAPFPILAFEAKDPANRGTDADLDWPKHEILAPLSTNE
jgi:hypothetical protein